MKNYRFFIALMTLLLALASPLASANDDVVRVNINTADAVNLAQVLDGIGEKKAQAIIAYREAYGPFKSVEELLAVKGVGEALLTKNQGLIILE